MQCIGGIPLCLLLALGGAGRSEAVIFLETADPAHHTSTPGDNSGWQYEGSFNSYLGVPIAPHFFITAKHIGGSVGDVLNFHGDLYTTIAAHVSPSADLRIWEVDHSKPFPTYAPLSSGAVDIGSECAVFGRGTQRGVELLVSGEPRGWKWGSSDLVKRWGRNLVTGTTDGGTGYGELLYCDFNNPGIAGECHLSTGDSGGGMFVLEDGLWRLAGIHYAVDGPFRDSPGGTSFNAAAFDARGLYIEDPPDWIEIIDEGEPVPSSFYSTRISASLPWISGIAPEVGSLALESFAAWQTLYFSPAEIATPATTGALADFDADGVSNLLEFALNLDPTFGERAIMEPGTGLRGLPAVRIENIAGIDRLTVEFVRRTGGSGAGLAYMAEFSTELDEWEEAGTETVDPLNTRWERVKIVDDASTLDEPRRFARLRVILTD